MPHIKLKGKVHMCIKTLVFPIANCKFSFFTQIHIQTEILRDMSTRNGYNTNGLCGGGLSKKPINLAAPKNV